MGARPLELNVRLEVCDGTRKTGQEPTGIASVGEGCQGWEGGAARPWHRAHPGRKRAKRSSFAGWFGPADSGPGGAALQCRWDRWTERQDKPGAPSQADTRKKSLIERGGLGGAGGSGKRLS